MKSAAKAVAFIALALSLTFSAGAKALKVACVGNSITYGYGLEHRDRDSYPSQLQQLLGDGYEVGNFGHSGATLLRKGHRPYVDQPAFRQALDFDADIAVIHLGLNDTDPRDWPDFRDEFISDYCALIDSFRVHNPSMRVMICRMTPVFHNHPRFKSSTRDWYLQVQDAIDRVAEHAGVDVIDLHEPLYHRPDLFRSDALHPDADGAGIIASEVSKAITGDYGGLKLPSVYTDGMVVQRDKPIAISGTANAGSPVTIRFGDVVRTTRAGNNGRWSVTLPPMSASSQGSLFTVMAPDSVININDVLVGDVWICSGQSNMAFQVAESVRDEVTEQIGYAESKPLIRLFDMRPRYYTTNEEWDSMALEQLNRLDYYEPALWVVADSSSVARFSAVGFAFGRNLTDSLQVPVGLIANAVGGAPTEAWIDRSTLERHLPDILYDFAENDMIQAWVRGRAMRNVAGKSPESQRHPYHPAYLYEVGMRPLEGFPVKGCIWYQGESNAHNAELHSRLFPLLVQSWRKGLDDDVPLYFVQLTSINRPSWPTFRDSQRRLADELSGVGMAVIHDLGDSLDVHPRHKMEVGRRLALLALHDTYGHDVEAYGPVPDYAVADADGGVVLHMSHSDGMHTSDGAAPRTFELAGHDRYYYPATVIIPGDGTVVLRSDKVDSPYYVRYAWQPYTTANMVNAAGLPASTFVMEVRR